MVTQLKGCCCGYSLKTGAIIIGALGVVTGLMMIIAAVAGPVHTEGNANEVFIKLENLSHSSSQDDRTFGMIIKIVMAFIEIIMSVVLIVGTVKGRPKLVYSWIVLNVVQNGLAVIVVVTVVVYVLVTGLVEAGLVALIALFIVLVTQGYMILVVNSFHTTILSPTAYEYGTTKEPIIYA